MRQVRKPTVVFGLLGIVAAAAGVAVGELVAALIDPAYAPIQVVSSAAIDVPPAPIKEWATATFGTSSKTVLIGTVVVAVVILAFVAGALSRKRLGLGAALALVIGVIGALAGVTRPTDDLLAPLPSVIAGIVAAASLVLFSRVVTPPLAIPSDGTNAPDRIVSSRRAFIAGGSALVGSGVIYAIARYVGNATSAAASRISSMLPAPVEPLPPLPASVQAPVAGLGPFVTPNTDFYRIDTAVVVPQVESVDWKLTIDGMVDRPMTITYSQLLDRPMVERDITLMCVSNPVGGEYIGNARWLGTPLMPLLKEAGMKAGADQLLSESIDGWTCSTPLDGLALREPLLVVGMNGEPLPIDHGFPVRMVIPGLYGYISATKWVTRITATTYQQAPAYWTVRGWATDAPVLTGSRIDVPSGGPQKPGEVTIAGIAWAMDGNGISQVEVQVDDGPWAIANLADEPNPVTWRQWWLPVQITEPGEHIVRVRATNGLGQTQTADEQDPFPQGATGYDSRFVFIEA